MEKEWERETAKYPCRKDATISLTSPTERKQLMDLTLLETLRFKISTAKDFSEVFEYFFDHFGEDPKFFEVGEPADNEMLVQMLGKIGGSIFKTDKVRLDNLRLVRIKEYNFIHGGMIMNGAMGNVIYCEDLQQGLLVIHRPGKNPPTHFARFTAEMLAPHLAKEASKFKQ